MKIRKTKKHRSLNKELNELYKAPHIKPRNKEERELMELVKKVSEEYFIENQ